jgi:hypothetical protein
MQIGSPLGWGAQDQPGPNPVLGFKIEGYGYLSEAYTSAQLSTIITTAINASLRVGGSQGHLIVG